MDENITPHDLLLEVESLREELHCLTQTKNDLLTYNQRFEKTFGIKSEDLIRPLPSDIFAPELADSTQVHDRPVLEYGKAELRRIAEARLQVKDTSAAALSVEDAQKMLHELQVHQIELEMQNEALLEARSAEEQALYRYTELFDFAPIGYFTIDPSSKIMQVNLRGANLLGTERSNLSGRRFLTYVALEYRVTFSDFLAKAFDSGDKQNCEVLVQDGKHDLWLSLEANIGVTATECLVAMSDITERRLLLSALSESEQKFRLLYDKTPVMMNSVNAKGIIETVNECWLKTMGYQLDEVVGKKRLHFFTDESREYSENEVLPKFLKDGYANDIKYDFVKKDGSVINVELSAICLYDDNGRMKSSLATMIDVTARNIAETRIKKLYTAVEHSPTVVIITNLDGIIEYVNPKFSDVTGYSSKEVLGQTPSILNSDTDQEMLHKDMWETIQSGDEWRGDFLNQKKDGSLYRDHVSVSPVKDENGKITHYVSIQEDITEESKLREKLSYHASHDELTGLINRREFEKRVTRLISTNQHSKAEHALCFMDLDQFKIINDTKGHPAGDEVLRQVANLLQKNVRNRDTLARLGGDEFGLLFEHCTLVQARRTLDTILLAVRNQLFLWEGEEFHLGISIGLVGMSETTTNFTELLKLADAACYAAKDSGRNRIHVFHSEDHGRT